MNCPKCSSTVLQIRHGYSQEDERGTSYSYIHCVLCGYAKHVLNDAERRAQVFEQVRLLPNALCVNGQKTVSDWGNPQGIL